MGDLVLSRERDGLHRHTTVELPHLGLVFRLAFIGPEQGGRRYVDPFETALDRREVRLDEIAHLGAELVHQERAAGTDHLGGRFGDAFADSGRKGREGQAREHVVGRAEAAVVEDLLDIRSRTRDRDQPRIVDRLLQIAGEIRVGVDRYYSRVGSELIEHWTGEGSYPRAIFDEQLRVRPVDRRKHPFNENLARWNDRADHHWVLQEAPQELPLRTRRTAVAAALKAA